MDKNRVCNHTGGRARKNLTKEPLSPIMGL